MNEHAERDALVIVGSGTAAYTLAKTWRKLDSNRPLVMVTQSNGAFYPKPVLSNALAKGLEPDAIPTFTADEMAEQLNATIMVHCDVRSIDRDKQCLHTDQGVVPYGHLVLATGARPILLALKGDALSAVAHINQWEDYAVQHPHLLKASSALMIGSGFVGCEFANDCASQGMAVDVLSLDAYPLARLVPEPVGRKLQAALTELGVQWHFHTEAQGVVRHDNGFLVEATALDGSDPKQFEVDWVLSAVGLRAHSDLAMQAHLNCDEGGICVDRYAQTSDPSIYALGDAAHPEGMPVLHYIPPILHAAKALAQTLSGRPTPVVYPVMPVMVKTPACPVAAVPLRAGWTGEWQDETDPDLQTRAPFSSKWCCYSTQGDLLAFALSGDCVKERQALAQKIAPWDQG